MAFLVAGFAALFYECRADFLTCLHQLALPFPSEAHLVILPDLSRQAAPGQ